MIPIRKGTSIKLPVRLFSMLDYVTPITGVTPTQNIEDITLSSGEPVLLTISDHGLADANRVYITDVVGTSELNGNAYEISTRSSDSISLVDTLSSCFSSYISGGKINEVFVKLSKGGAAPADPDDGAWAELSTATLLDRGNDGTYTVSLSSTDTNTEGPLTVHVDCGRAVPAVLALFVEDYPVDINNKLSSVHGSSSWEGLDSSDVWAYATRTLTSFGTLVADIDSQLSSTHSSGSWEGSSAAPTVEEISNYLSCIHGSCSWETAGTVTVNSSDIWTYATRTLTSFDSLVDDIANKLSSVHGSCSWETGSGSTDWPTVEEINNYLTSQHGSGSWKTGSASGTGSEEVTYKVTEPPEETGTAIAGVFVWVTTDAVGANIVASGNTDNFGEVTFWLNPGTYYFWRQKYGYNFTNPDTEVVSS